MTQPSPIQFAGDEPEELSDDEIIRIGETLGEQIPGLSDYTSWPGLGYRMDENGEYKIPKVPDVAVEFARRVIRAALANKESP